MSDRHIDRLIVQAQIRLANLVVARELLCMPRLARDSAVTSQELGGTVEHDLPDLENVDADEDLRVDRGAALGGVITYFATQEPP